MGHIAPLDSIGPIVQALVWTTALVVLGRRVLARGCERMAIQGG
jgi:ABC-type uncharacterized transport system permease subunit